MFLGLGLPIIMIVINVCVNMCCIQKVRSVAANLTCFWILCFLHPAFWYNYTKQINEMHSFIN
jgi:hypothetical protein